MKPNLIYSVIVLFITISCNTTNSNDFVLNGKIDGLRDSTEIELSYMSFTDGVWSKIDEKTYSTDNRFIFKGKTDGLTAAFLSFGNNSIDLYLEPITVTLEADIDSLWDYKLSGMKSDGDISLLNSSLKAHYERLHKQTAEIFNILDRINSATENSSNRDSLISILTNSNRKRYDYVREIDNVRYEFALDNINRAIAPVLAYSLARTNLIDIDKIVYLYDSLPIKLKESVAGSLAKKQIAQSKKQFEGRDIAVGSAAPNFSGIDTNGDKIQLSDQIGKKLILLDFWASWCSPCLAQLPQLKSVANRFSPSDVEIISISLDSDREAWINAIDNHKINSWSHILSTTDSKDDYFKNDISNDYGVETIPRYFLINGNGEITAIWSSLDEEKAEFIEQLLRIMM